MSECTLSSTQGKPTDSKGPKLVMSVNFNVPTLSMTHLDKQGALSLGQPFVPYSAFWNFADVSYQS